MPIAEASLATKKAQRPKKASRNQESTTAADTQESVSPPRKRSGYPRKQVSPPRKHRAQIVVLHITQEKLDWLNMVYQRYQLYLPFVWL